MANVKRANTSGLTKSGAAIADVPDRPSIGSATAVDATSATVTYTAATTGGTATTFTATSTPGSLTGTGSSPITVAGLTELTSYTFTVRASNSTGNSPFSSASNSITTLADTAFQSIATYTVASGGQSNISFTSIPSTYKHLQIRWTAATNDGNFNALIVRYNSDSGSNYSWHVLSGNGSTVSTETGVSDTNIRTTGTPGTTQSNIFNAAIYDILDYTNTNKYKTSRILGGTDANGSGYSTLSSGLWRDFGAISSITIAPITGGGLIVQNSKFALYGIKGA
jgi:hypothetical protein